MRRGVGWGGSVVIILSFLQVKVTCNMFFFRLQRVASTNDNIDIVESAQSFLEHYIGSAISLVLHSGKLIKTMNESR